MDDGAALAHLLSTFGVTVVPDVYGGFVHHAAAYIVSNGRLRAIYDYTILDDLFGDVWRRAR